MEQADFLDTLEKDSAVCTLVAGVDEVGRGPLAGPVVAAAVILGENFDVSGLKDSKKLSARQRAAQAERIRTSAIAWSLGWASVEEIDRINILHASLLAMKRAIDGLELQPGEVLVDGNRIPDGLAMPARAIVGGDASEAAISAASILAKEVRDDYMRELDDLYPGYGLGKHAGYPTAMHLEALRNLGVTPVHRRSFRPVRILLESAD